MYIVESVSGIIAATAAAAPRGVMQQIVLTRVNPNYYGEVLFFWFRRVDFGLRNLGTHARAFSMPAASRLLCGRRLDWMNGTDEWDGWMDG